MPDDLSAEIRAATRNALKRFAPTPAGDTSPTSAPGPTGPLWRTLVNVGALALEVPTADGGAGRSFADVCTVIEESARLVLPGDYASCAALGLGAALLNPDINRRTAQLETILAGTGTITAALTGPDGTPDTVSVEAAPTETGYILQGVAGFVPGAVAAAAVVVAARLPGAAHADSLFCVPVPVAGLDRQPVAMVDRTRELSTLTLDRVTVDRAAAIGEPGHSHTVIGRLLNRAAIATAADSLGSAERVLELTVDHLRHRHQFGRPIGSFQALKHRCATMFLRLQMARAAVEHAALVVDDVRQADAAASIAKSFCGQYCSLIAEEGVQMHGAIGFTTEHEMHLHLKRQALDAALYGDVIWHRQRIARLGLT